MADVLNVPKSTSHDTVKESSTREHQQSMPRSGRPHKLDGRTIRLILSHVGDYLKWKYQQLIDALLVPISHSTLYRIAKDYGLHSFRVKQRSLLTQKTVHTHLQWCKNNVNRTLDMWFRVIFSRWVFYRAWLWKRHHLGMAPYRPGFWSKYGYTNQ